MAYDPNQPRDKIGRWTVAGSAAWKAAGLKHSDQARNFPMQLSGDGICLWDSKRRVTR